MTGNAHSGPQRAAQSRPDAAMDATAPVRASEGPLRPFPGHPGPRASGRTALTADERALADRIARQATRLRDGAGDDGPSIRGAVELAVIQMGDIR